MKITPFVLAAILPCLATANPRHGLRLEWVIKSSTDRNGNPHSQLALSIDGKQVPIQGDVREVLKPMDRSDFEPHLVPKNAIIACSGWWAGAGDVFYVSRKGTRLRIYQQMGDCAPDSGIQAWRRIKSIKL